MSTKQAKSVSLTAMRGAGPISRIVESGRTGERLRTISDGTDLSTTERLEYALSLIPPEEFETRVGRSWKQIQRYLKGADIPLSVLTMIHVATGIPADWMVSGRAWSEADVLRWLKGERSGEEKPEGEFAYLPRYEARASAGRGLLAVSEQIADELAFRRDWLSRLGVNPKNAGLLTAEGDSMAPTIPDGAIMLVDFSIRDVRNGIIYVMIREGAVIVKRMQVKAGGSIVLISDNERYERETITRDSLADLQIAGRVVWVGHAV